MRVTGVDLPPRIDPLWHHALPFIVCTPAERAAIQQDPARVPRPARYVLPLEIVTAHDPLRQERLERRENQKPFRVLFLASIKSLSSLLAFSVLFLGRENIAANGSRKRACGYGRQPHLEVLPLPPAKGNTLLREPARVGVAC
jgi:hypothetical protein